MCISWILFWLENEIYDTQLPRKTYSGDIMDKKKTSCGGKNMTTRFSVLIVGEKKH